MVIDASAGEGAGRWIATVAPGSVGATSVAHARSCVGAGGWAAVVAGEFDAGFEVETLSAAAGPAPPLLEEFDGAGTRGYGAAGPEPDGGSRWVGSS